MKTIIAVWNSAGKGKSSSTREFAELVSQNYPDHLTIRGLPSEIKPTGDFIWGANIGGNNIGVVSQGDPGTDLIRKVEDLIKKECNIIICSTRTRGVDVTKLAKLSKLKGYEIIWTSTYEVEDDTRRKFINRLKGKHILDLIQSISIYG